MSSSTQHTVLSVCLYQQLSATATAAPYRKEEVLSSISLDEDCYSSAYLTCLDINHIENSSCSAVPASRVHHLARVELIVHRDEACTSCMYDATSYLLVRLPVLHYTPCQVALAEGTSMQLFTIWECLETPSRQRPKVTSSSCCCCWCHLTSASSSSSSRVVYRHLCRLVVGVLLSGCTCLCSGDPPQVEQRALFGIYWPSLLLLLACCLLPLLWLLGLYTDLGRVAALL